MANLRSRVRDGSLYAMSDDWQARSGGGTVRVEDELAWRHVSSPRRNDHPTSASVVGGCGEHGIQSLVRRCGVLAVVRDGGRGR